MGLDPTAHAGLLKSSRIGKLAAVRTVEEGFTQMPEVTIWTLDWVPEGPRGFVRDLRLRWGVRGSWLGLCNPIGSL